MKDEKDTFGKPGRLLQTTKSLPGLKSLSQLVKQHQTNAGSGIILLRRNPESFLLNLNEQQMEGQSHLFTNS